MRRASIAFPPHEQLIVVDDACQVISVANGRRSGVDDDGNFIRQAVQAGEAIVLIHNHPEGTGLSPSDLGQLTKPGVEAIVAVGHDGSIYAASLDKHRVPRETLVTVVSTAQAELLKRAAGVPLLDNDVFMSQLNHLVSIVLREARVIRYRYVLGTKRRTTFDRFRDELLRMADATRQRVLMHVHPR